MYILHRSSDGVLVQKPAQKESNTDCWSELLLFNWSGFNYIFIFFYGLRKQTSYFKKWFFVHKQVITLFFLFARSSPITYTSLECDQQPSIPYGKTIPNCYENAVKVQSVPSSVADMHSDHPRMSNKHTSIPHTAVVAGVYMYIHKTRLKRFTEWAE